MKRIILILLSILTISSYAQIPSGYYNGTESLTGVALQQQLHGIIDNHNSVSYTSLWTHLQNTDKKSNNTVWDMYSDVPGGTPPYTFTFVSDQCGNYGQEGDCYNREHSWPKSWFNDSSPMSTDIFHLYPTDGYVNGQRSNYPFGETNSATWTSQNGSKKGPCSYPGNSGIVFEPIDEYKGDFARTYFYMSTRYYNEDGSWQSNDMVIGAELKQWAKNMLIEWHTNDPVSDKELDRNNAAYQIQNNRNPFIDHSEFSKLIFGLDYPQPILNGTPSDTVTENNYYEFVVSALDDHGNSISFSSIIMPSWLTLVDQGNNTAIITGTPGNSEIGIHEVKIIATNSYSEPVELLFSVEVIALNGIYDNKYSNMGVAIFPNPVGGILNVKSGVELEEIKVFCIDGKEIKSFNSLNKNQLSLNIKDIEVGVYILKLKDIHGNISNLRFIKN